MNVLGYCLEILNFVFMGKRVEVEEIMAEAERLGEQGSEVMVYNGVEGVTLDQIDRVQGLVRGALTYERVVVDGKVEFFVTGVDRIAVV